MKMPWPGRTPQAEAVNLMDTETQLVQLGWSRVLGAVAQQGRPYCSTVLDFLKTFVAANRKKLFPDLRIEKSCSPIDKIL